MIPDSPGLLDLHPPTRQDSPKPPARGFHRVIQFSLIAVFGTVFVVVLAVLAARFWLSSAARSNLPQLSGSLVIPGLSAPVTITRDLHGLPTIRATTFDDALFAQGFVTAQDRLFQMDTLRRHAAGELAEILGSRLVPHDRLQRTLGLGPVADRILTQLPPDQVQHLERYTAGVNAAMFLQRAHLPLEFRILGYDPRPWTARDSVLVSLVLFEDLTNTFPSKLNREALTARLAPSATAEARAELLADLYPVGSWRDHPPSQPATDLTTPLEEFPEIPLDDSQVKLRHPTVDSGDLLALTGLTSPSCPDCRAGSNNFAVSGAHTASGKPLLANDMHLSLSAPGIWYAVNLEAHTGPDQTTAFHAAGVSLPGVPYVVVGHNDHVTWGFTNLGADVQDLYIEHLRRPGATSKAQSQFSTEAGAQFQDSSGAWQDVHYRSEILHVRGGQNISFQVLSTRHGDVETPLINAALPSETRPISLRWSLYDTDRFSLPFAAFDAATSASDLLQAARTYTGPAQNLIAADDAGHIAYHAIGRIPVRGASASLSPVPTDVTAPEAAAHEWSSVIPFDQLPSTIDPPGGLLATANARITPENYFFPITLNWADPYRNERIWRLLTNRTDLTPQDMLHIQTDVFSDSDHLIAQRLAYAIDRSSKATKRLRAAADLLRAWDGNVASTSAAAAITTAAREALWPMLLAPKLALSSSLALSSVHTVSGEAKSSPQPTDPASLYTWGERNFALEQLIAHTPARWLPPAYATWDDLLTAAVDKGVLDSHAPNNLAKWSIGKTNPVEIQLPLFAQLPMLSRLAGLPTGSGTHPQSGNSLTVRQSRHTFGPSERFTADLADPDAGTLVLPLGQSGNPLSPWFRDQFPAWLGTSTFPLPFRSNIGNQTLTLTPK